MIRPPGTEHDPGQNGQLRDAARPQDELEVGHAASIEGSAWRPTARTTVVPICELAFPQPGCFPGRTAALCSAAVSISGRISLRLLPRWVACRMRPLLVRGGAVWQLVGLITRRSQVQI